MKIDLKRKILSIAVIFAFFGSVCYIMASIKKREYAEANKIKTGVTLNKKHLYVDFDQDGQYRPFFIKGICYNPMPIGRHPSDFGYEKKIEDRSDNIFDDEEILHRDFNLIKKMHANTIRIWKANNTAVAKKRRPTWGGAKSKSKPKYKHPNFLTEKTLDLAEEYGLKVIPGFWIDTGKPVCKNWEKVVGSPDFTDKEVREEYLTKFKKFIRKFKKHPAVLFWAIGNENNYDLNQADFDQMKAFYSLIDEMAEAAHAIEGPTHYHPVAFVNGGIKEIGDLSFGTTDLLMPHLDIWGVTAYNGNTFGDLFKEYEKKSKKALWIAEFGVDAFHAPALEYPESGKEDEKAQSEWLANLWNDLIKNRKHVLGGCIKEYSDEWWKPDENIKQGRYNSRHDPFGIGFRDYDCDGYIDWTAPAPDKFFHEEWFGLMKVSNLGQPYDTMLPRQAYYTFKDLFYCDPLQDNFLAGKSNDKSCDGSEACCPDPSQKAQGWQCVEECAP